MVSHTDPHHTPSDPTPAWRRPGSRGQCRPPPERLSATPPRRPRVYHRRRELPGVSARLGALRDDEIHSRRGVLYRMLPGAGQRRDHFVGVGACDHVGQRRAKGTGDQPDVVRERHTEQHGGPGSHFHDGTSY
ncbi:hypothetical protein I553_2146 [Mycobacterium xenopi 4042]|uniref:Uncharacterized protein n=1 Tax=Mycobacterium xenopi 4042 TaxID=1299334 RepID=X8DML6_MYCXE|nr:hypothetical protein I553_2146 [Mycobacterium xenopi 4042]